MTTPKFTPGPWVFQKHEDFTHDEIFGFFVQGAGGEEIVYFDNDDKSTTPANARLIAAAPELYGMVRELLEFLEPMRFDRRSDDDRAIVLDTEMRALLAKIDGGDHA